MKRTSVYTPEDDLLVIEQIAEREMLKPSDIIRKALRDYIRRDPDYSLFLNECSQKKTNNLKEEQKAA